ncbi:TetR/AcrR family transcriptional regulator [Fodinicola acaciae]|uniref:TetR/AcrR family transcriptional regulator n=1 Tax=Fodinicola acaciae TaxID=2681555 RepID=UPI0013D66421|nr:TetR/AcrR family transcriptional regulator [Fodinicola acaciae]
MSGRRTDTRERIQQVALELFSERGYDKTSLREVAERLEITRPALYYHFRTKEDILVSVIDDLNASMDELIAWAADQPRDRAGRLATLRRVSALLNDKWRPILRFAQLNQNAMRDLHSGMQMEDRMLSLISMVADPDSPPERQFESWLAIIALLMGTMPFVVPALRDDERARIAMETAIRLIDQPKA